MKPMPKSERGVSELLGDISRDARTLVAQQFDLARTELGQELRQAGTAAACLAGGGGLAVAGGLLTGFALAQFIRDTTGLPLWLCYGIAAGGVGATGGLLLKAGRDGLAELKPLPETVAAFEENVEWLKDQLTPAE
jgi:hypothetical protein